MWSTDPPMSSVHRGFLRPMAVLLLVAPAAGYVAMSRPPLARPRPAASIRMQIDVFSAVDTFYQSAPIQAAFVTCGVKASLSDTISQRSATGNVTRGGFCFSRNSAFILYGAIYQGVTQHFIYNDFFPVCSSDPSHSTGAREAGRVAPIALASPSSRRALRALQILFGSGNDAGTVAAKVAFDQLVHAPRFSSLSSRLLRKSPARLLTQI